VTTESSEAIVVMLTAPSGEEAAGLAEMLVENNLAACVQILSQMESVYRWRGGIEHQVEILLIAKTLASKFAELEREVRALHSYETPEIVALPITAGSAPYLEWLSANIDSHTNKKQA
jgi:periplasmic divalent cation tolerance protein